ncbi:hypothetical protein [Streptomyces sp. CB03238]|uniref:hypothetical protein n=1 Tax=Streptomyces sp. CB03238 TaxID=1907777 RepID=UPI000A12313F|nr:hypothetical protein [Streptomyces sp. CB03238]ORT58747.1 hypothetical protein BKD26_16335 [Streptomyces sp. CB03238]
MRIRHCTAIAALALLAAACSGTENGTKSEDVSGEGKKADQALEYRKCLREQGLDVPEPKPGEDPRGIAIGGDLSKEQMEKAFKACRSKSGAAGSGEITQADKDKALKFARCMRENGVNMPDPKFDGAAQQALPMPTAGPEKEKFDKAMKVCGGETR